MTANNRFKRTRPLRGRAVNQIRPLGLAPQTCRYNENSRVMTAMNARSRLGEKVSDLISIPQVMRIGMAMMGISCLIFCLHEGDAIDHRP